MTKGENELKSIARVPIVKSSTVLVMVEGIQVRDVVASEFQFSVALAEKDILAPISNARRRALSKHQNRCAHTNGPIFEGGQLTSDTDPTHRSRDGPRPGSPRSE